MTEEKKPLTAADVRAALKRRYAAPDYGIVFEVAQSTGHSAHRHLDAIAMDLWPSRGLALHGIEVKVGRGDFLKELKTPEKAEQMARFCDYFHIAAPAGLIKVAELPMAWGLLEVGDDGKVVQKKAATPTAAADIDRAFLAAVFRAATRQVDPATLDAVMNRRKQELEAEFRERVKREAEYIASRRSTDAENWKKLCEALGRNTDDDLWDIREDEIIQAVKLVMAAGVAKTWGGIKALISSVEEAHEKLTACATEFGIQPEGKFQRIKRRVKGEKAA